MHLLHDGKKEFMKGEYMELWEATACGSALQGETPVSCAHRELEEETGIIASELTEVGRIVDKNKHSVYVEFVCVTDWDKDNIRLQEGETIAYKWVTGSELIARKEDEIATYRIWEFIDDFCL